MQTIDKVLSARNRNEVELTEGNLTEACKDVVRNKGSWGIDKMSVKELKPYLDKNREELSETIRHGEYIPQPIKGKEVPKRNRKKRLLGIPTVVDRMLQQAVTRALRPQFEYMFYSLYNYFQWCS